MTSVSSRPWLPASQPQLERLWDTILQHEEVPKPFAGLPSGIDLTKFEILAGPPTYDETIAPATVLKSSDHRAIWLSVFRNPDNNEIVKPHIMVIDPPVNMDKRPLMPRVDYELHQRRRGRMAIKRFLYPRRIGVVTRAEVADLQNLIDGSEKFPPY